MYLLRLRPSCLTINSRNSDDQRQFESYCPPTLRYHIYNLETYQSHKISPQGNRFNISIRNGFGPKFTRCGITKFSFRNNNISVFVFCSPFDVPHETEVIPFNYHHHTAFILIKKFYVNLEFYVDLILCWLGLRKIVFNANSVC